MKTSRIFALILAGILLASSFTSCSKKDDEKSEDSGANVDASAVVGEDEGNFAVPEGVAEGKEFNLYIALASCKQSYIAEEETGAEINTAVKELKKEYESIVLIANSIGAFFSMNAGIDAMIERAFFISPIVDMEKLICDMIQWANVTEEELRSKGVISTGFGEDLSWDYLCYVRSHPIRWEVPTQILYGGDRKSVV